MITVYGKTFDPKALIAEEGFKAEWREKMTDEEYHADKTAVGSSTLRKARRSLFSFAAHLIGGEEPTEAMKFGTLVHLAILEPNKFKSLYVVQPVFEGYTSKGELTTSLNCKDVQRKIAAWKAQQHPKAVFVTEKEKEKLLCMIDSVMSHPMASELLRNVKTEVAGYARDPRTGIRVKIKQDIISCDVGYQTDLKTCNDSYWPEFRRTVESKAYYFQDAQYAGITEAITGIKPEHRSWIAVQNKFPFETAVHEVHPAYQERGERQYNEALTAVKTAIDENSFPMRDLGAPIGEPSYFFKKEAELETEQEIAETDY